MNRTSPNLSIWDAQSCHRVNLKRKLTMEKLNDPDRFISVKDTAELIGVSVSTVRRLIERSDFPNTFKITESRIGLLESEVKRWMEETYRKGQAANDN
ncbi:AlpA family phage regulatory protein [bacterium]|nr:AlpA family phage regulatory protein [bacterium]